MSENGPYGQQPGYQPPYGGSGPQYAPHDQPMYGGGPPPYGPGPGGPPPGAPGPGGAPGYPPPKKSSAGLWIVIGGGVIIVILVIAVIFMLLRNDGSGGGGGGGEPGGGGAQSTTDEPTEPEETEDTQAGGGPQGEPPYALPEDPCSSVSEGTLADLGATDGSKSLTDTSSYCMWSVKGEGDQYGNLTVTYDVPYGGSDSVEGAKEDFKSNVERASEESSEIIETKVDKVDENIDLGEEATMVFGTQKVLQSRDSLTTLLIRQGNINITVEYMLSPGYQADEDTPPPLKYDDVKDVVPGIGEEALSLVGS
ncbi:DUF3558 domain-containing protein [Nocardiopsis sp. RSe5-2]|uniref:DUF3558 domain-containing protein n=1 Tax=Nocardiopsis endophytica TaxID=3018445 RepID=A0ABT4U6W8_9ACTN|nr:DUF3558 domain-containing protein [Nocardiopsis endophytica]MDA2812693.1 DUF3558 domain-containing protein [Nocardiopsis endophytica]